MKRREFIKLSTRTAMALSLSGIYSPLNAGSNDLPKVVINVMLDGGPDFRHLIVPIYDTNSNSYAAKFWQARASIFGASSSDELKDAYDEHYETVKIDNKSYGILKKASWLKVHIEGGHVAIISNAIGSTNRNHHHAQLMIESGNMNASPYNQDVSGWMGRTANALTQNVVSITSEVRLACNGPHLTDPKRHDNSCVVNNYKSRDMNLYFYDTQDDSKHSEKAIMSRALRSYYTAKSDTIPASSPYYKAMQHEKQLREFGDQIQTILKNNDTPEEILNLTEKNHENRLNSSYFARQISSCYDSFLTRDILDMRLASMEYTGWDSHKNLRNQIEPKFEDMFGTDKGFDALISSLDIKDKKIYEKTVIVISGEFGRQHLSNGDHGNDHGRGNTVLILGGDIKGGLYGDIFPDSEKDKLNTKNADIKGETSMLKIYSAVLDWQEAGLGDKIFGSLSNQSVEAGVKLSDIFA